MFAPESLIAPVLLTEHMLACIKCVLVQSGVAAQAAKQPPICASSWQTLVRLQA